jgi:predicted Zn finger-like uncharacterized protein
MNVSCPDCRSIFRVDPAKVPPTGVRARCSVCSGVISIPAPTGQNTPPSGSERAPGSPSEQGGARSTPAAQSGWDPAPFAPSSPRSAPPPPAAAPRAVESPASPRSRPEAIDRGTAAATATPPSPASVLPEFTPPPPLPPFRPAGAPSFSAPTASPFPAPAAPPFVPSAARSATPQRPATTPSLAPVVVPSSSPPAIGSDGGARRPLNPFLSKDPNQRAKRLARALVSDIITYHPATHAEGLRDGTLKQLFREEIKKSFEEYIAQVGQQLAESTTYFQEALNEVLGAGKKIF